MFSFTDIQFRFGMDGSAPSLEIRCSPDAPLATNLWVTLESFGIKALSPYIVRKGDRLIVHTKVARKEGSIDQTLAARLLKALHALGHAGEGPRMKTHLNRSTAACESVPVCSGVGVDSTSRETPLLSQVPHSRPWQSWQPQELQG